MEKSGFDLTEALVWIGLMFSPFLLPRYRHACHTLADRSPNLFAAFLGLYVGLAMAVLFTGLTGVPTYEPGVTGGVAAAIGSRLRERDRRDRDGSKD